MARSRVPVASWAALVFCLAAAACAAEWTAWDLGPGREPLVTEDGTRICHFRRLHEGWAFVSCALDGSDAISHAGARSEGAEPALAPEEVAAPPALGERGRLALIGRRILLLLRGGSRAEVASLLGAPDGAPPTAVALAAASPTLAAAYPDGSLRLAGPDVATGPRRYVLPEVASSLQVSGDGALALASSEDRGWLIRTADGTVAAELTGGPCALSGDGRRYAFVTEEQLERVALGRTSQPARIALPARPARALMLDGDGRHLFLLADEALWRLAWVGERWDRIADCSDAARFSVSGDGRVVAFEADGRIRVASADARETPPTQPVHVERPRDLPSIESVLPGLEALAARIARQSEPDRPSGLLARDPQTGWGLYRQADPPLSLRVPPEWSVAPASEPGGLDLASPGGDRSIAVRTMRGPEADPAAWADAHAEALGIASRPQPVTRLLGGVSGLEWRLVAPDGAALLLAAARWADGLVGLIARYPDGETPAELRTAVESLALEPWPTESDR